MKLFLLSVNVNSANTIISVLSCKAFWIAIILLPLILVIIKYYRKYHKYLWRLFMVRDLNYEGEDPSLISKDRRILSQVVPLWRIGHSKAVALWYGNPSRKLKLVGVTGTNGKTTTATLLYELFRKMGYRCGLLSTVCNYINDEAIPTDHTTPKGTIINHLLNKMVKEGCEYVFMECSSHGLVQKRVSGLRFKGAIFTNLTRDHLDFHRTVENYRNAKKSFFDQLSPQAFALVNSDDESSKVMVKDCKATVKTYSLLTEADFTGKILESKRDGMQMEINGQKVDVNLIGRFNASNLLAIYGAAVLLGKKPEDILPVLHELKSVKGRLDPVHSPKGFTAYVDYAHTPDALQNVLTTIHELLGENGRIITVCGAGGNRDKGKRPLMAQVVAQLSDYVVLTSDDPRNEDPQDIINDMLAGLDKVQMEKVTSIIDRKEAIQKACEMAKKGDVVLVAGKGHEKRQVIKGVEVYFSDMEVLGEIFSK